MNADAVFVAIHYSSFDSSVSQTEVEVEAIRRYVARGQPYGGGDWVRRTAQELGLESTLRAPHRPRKITGKGCSPG